MLLCEWFSYDSNRANHTNDSHNAIQSANLSGSRPYRW